MGSRSRIFALAWMILSVWQTYAAEVGPAELPSDRGPTPLKSSFRFLSSESVLRVELPGLATKAGEEKPESLAPLIGISRSEELNQKRTDLHFLPRGEGFVAVAEVRS